MSLLAIDRGRKYIGLAGASDTHSIIFPLWTLENAPESLFSLAHIVAERKICLVIVGYPSKQQDIQKKIDTFIRDLSFVIPEECKITKVNEDYSSVQAGAKLGNYKKTAAEDSMAAVYIMEEYKRNLL
jgi:RNase H-fold protein (predicted Holliday junction resolvase)